MSAIGEVAGERWPSSIPTAMAVAGVLSAGFAAQRSSEMWQTVHDRPAAAVPSAVLAPPAIAPSVEDRPSSAPVPECAPLIVEPFPYGSPEVPARLEAPLAKLGAWLAGHVSSTVLVDGHADALGAEDNNLRISRRRALAVAAILEGAGLSHERVTARGFGAFQPIEGAPAEAASNRRVVVYVKNAGDCPPALAQDAQEDVR